MLGAEILRAERTARPVTPLTGRYPDLTLADAYAVQKAYAQQRTSAGARLIGHKVGATSKAIQDLFGIDTPDYGHLFDDMLVAEGVPIPVGSLIQPMAEPEIAFLLAEAVRGPGVTAEEIVSRSRGVMPCIEIIDSRIVDWRIRLADTVADNGSSARFVVGELVDVTELDLARELVALRQNGSVVGEGVGTAVLGHPAVAAAWLANALGEYGVELSAGSYVLSGSLTTAVPVRRGDRFVAEFSTIGTVSCRFE
jgi:2-oxopent-4-enoate hydratase